MPITSPLTNGRAGPGRGAAPDSPPRGVPDAPRACSQSGGSPPPLRLRSPAARGGARRLPAFRGAGVRTGETFVQPSIKVTWGRCRLSPPPPPLPPPPPPPRGAMARRERGGGGGLHPAPRLRAPPRTGANEGQRRLKKGGVLPVLEEAVTGPGCSPLARGALQDPVAECSVLPLLCSTGRSVPASQGGCGLCLPHVLQRTVSTPGSDLWRGKDRNYGFVSLQQPRLLRFAGWETGIRKCFPRPERRMLSPGLSVKSWNVNT
ncbi:uncharacterized protein GJ701_017248 [Geothlypis trichas]